MADLTDGQLFGLIMVLLGVVAFFAVLIWRYRTLRLYKRAVPGMAKVIDVQRQSGEGGSMYAAEITFTDSTGEKVYSAVYSKKNVYAVGQSLRIVYDPNRPKKAVPQSGKWNEDKGLLEFGMAWVLVLIFLIPGIVLTLIPIGNLICDDPTFQDMAFCTQQRP